MNRRHFLKLAGSGLVVATAAPIVEPVRRFWQVGRGAPVGDLFAVVGGEGRLVTSATGCEWATSDDPIADMGALIEHVQAQSTVEMRQFKDYYEIQLNYML